MEMIGPTETSRIQTTYEGVSSEEAKSLVSWTLGLALLCQEREYLVDEGAGLDDLGALEEVVARSVPLLGFLVFCFFDGERADLYKTITHWQETNEGSLT